MGSFNFYIRIKDSKNYYIYTLRKILLFAWFSGSPLGAFFDNKNKIEIYLKNHLNIFRKKRHGTLIEEISTTIAHEYLHLLLKSKKLSTKQEHKIIDLIGY